MDGYLPVALRSGVTLPLAAGLVGCGGGENNGGTDPAETTTTSTSEEPFPTPTTESTTPTTEDPSPSEDGPVLTLASLPIGGNAQTDPDDPARQCVDISWIVTTDANPVIPKGYAVEITAAVFSAGGFEVVESGCGSSRPNCIGRIMRVGQDTCDLAVRALPDADPAVTVVVGLKGILYCPKGVGLQQCQDFAEAVADEPGVTIELDAAAEPTTDTGTQTGADTGTGTRTDTPTGGGG